MINPDTDSEPRAAADGQQDECGGRNRVRDEPETFRPALVTLADDIEALQSELFTGFDDRAQLPSWCQRLTIRTLGELPQRVYWELARQFTLDTRDDQPQGVLLAALLTPAARSRRLPDDAVDELRDRLVATQVRPAFHRAFRELRTDATEYVDESSDDDQHDPSRQRHPGMRPALTELDEWQQHALTDVLNGFDDQRAILKWSRTVELATHGELDEVQPPQWASTAEDGATTIAGDRDLIGRCLTEPATRALLLSDEDATAPARELFAAYHLIPAFNKGVRTLAGRAGELPDVETVRQTPTPM